MRLSKIEKYLVTHRRSRLKKKEFDPNFWRVAKGLLPVPADHNFKEIWGSNGLSFGEIAFVLRTRAKVTTRGLGQELGVSHQTITNWEHDRKGHVQKQIMFLQNHMSPSEARYLRNKYGLQLNGR